MKQPGDQLSLVLPAASTCGVLLYKVAPCISAMLMDWFEQEEYVAVELTRSDEALEWLVDSQHDLLTHATLFDLTTEIDPPFLRQVHDLASLTIGIRAYAASGVSRHFFDEFFDVMLPRPFRVKILLTILDEYVKRAHQPR